MIMRISLYHYHNNSLQLLYLTATHLRGIFPKGATLHQDTQLCSVSLKATAFFLI